jgi:putative solute:sodium symporter small subunit
MLVEVGSDRVALSRFWRRHGLLVAVLTTAWLLVSFLPPLIADGPRLPWLNISLSMGFMAELAPLAFVCIAWIYAKRADALDAEYGAAKR